MNLLDMITVAYLLSMIVMPIWTNIRPIYKQPIWNKTKSLCVSQPSNFSVLKPPLTLFKLNKTEYLMNIKNETEKDLDNTDILMVGNQVVVAVFGKF